jgi:glycosyltransferase involved in cell wall biosynthesis
MSAVDKRPIKLFRITTVPISLHKLLHNQLKFMSSYFEVTGISSPGQHLEKVKQTQGVPCYAVSMTRQITPVKDLQALWKLYRYMKKERPAIVHTHTPKAGLLGMMASWMAGVPVRLHTVAGLPQLEARGMKRKLLDMTEKITYAFSTMVYPNSFRMRDIIIENKYCKPGKLRVIGNGSSNGIDTTYFDPAQFDDTARDALRRELNIAAGDLVFCFVGRMVTDKGINEMIGAFTRLRAQRPDVKLLLVGPFENELTPVDKDVEETILHDPDIRFLDYQEDVRPYLYCSDVFVFPSYREGFPNVVLQAGALGLPAIVSDINGSNEIVQHGRNGLIVPVKNVDALFDAMLELTDNTTRRQEMAAVSRDAILDRYDQVLLWEQILAEYRRLLN